LKDYLGNVVTTFEDPISTEEISLLQNSLTEAETKVLAMRSSVESKSEVRTEVTNKNTNLAAVVAAQENIENAVDPKEEIQGEKFEREVVKTKWQTFFEYIRNIFR
jgi:transcriptional regulator